MFDRVPVPWPFPAPYESCRLSKPSSLTQAQTAHRFDGSCSASDSEPEGVAWPPLPTRPKAFAVEWERPLPRKRFFEEHGLCRCPPGFDVSEPIEEGSIKEWVHLVSEDSVNRSIGYAARSTKWRDLAKGLRLPMNGSALSFSDQSVFVDGERRKYCPPIEDFFRPHTEDWRPPPGFFVPPGLCLPPWHRTRADRMRKEEQGEEEKPEEKVEERKPLPRGRRVDVRALIRKVRDAKRSCANPVGKVAATDETSTGGRRCAPSSGVPEWSRCTPRSGIPPRPNSSEPISGDWDGAWPVGGDGWDLPVRAQVHSVAVKSNGDERCGGKPYGPPKCAHQTPNSLVQDTRKDSNRYEWDVETPQWRTEWGVGRKGSSNASKPPAPFKRQRELEADADGWGVDPWKPHTAESNNGWGRDPRKKKNAAAAAAAADGWGVQVWKAGGNADGWGEQAWKPKENGAKRGIWNGWEPYGSDGVKNGLEQSSKQSTRWEPDRLGRRTPWKQFETKKSHWY